MKTRNHPKEKSIFAFYDDSISDCLSVDRSVHINIFLNPDPSPELLRNYFHSLVTLVTSQLGGWEPAECLGGEVFLLARSKRHPAGTEVYGRRSDVLGEPGSDRLRVQTHHGTKTGRICRFVRY